MKIYFVRHGESFDDIYNEFGSWSERELTPHGIKTAFLVAEKLKKINENKTVNTRSSMSEKHEIPGYFDESGFYEIRLKGYLDERWADRLGDVVITLEENGNTLLTCLVIDQAVLHGLLKRVRDLGMPLLSVNSVMPGQEKIRRVNRKS